MTESVSPTHLSSQLGVMGRRRQRGVMHGQRVSEVEQVAQQTGNLALSGGQRSHSRRGLPQTAKAARTNTNTTHNTRRKTPKQLQAISCDETEPSVCVWGGKRIYQVCLDTDRVKKFETCNLP